MPYDHATQRMNALAKAQAIRLAGVAIGRKVKAGEISIIDLLAAPPDCITAIPINRIIDWAPGIGPVKTRMILKNIPGLIDLSTPIGRVPQHRRDVIIGIMRDGTRPYLTPTV